MGPKALFKAIGDWKSVRKVNEKGLDCKVARSGLVKRVKRIGWCVAAV